jgi:hypothetical protein
VLALYGCSYLFFEGIDFRGGKWTTIYGDACSFIIFRDCAIGYGQTGLGLTSADPARSSHHALIERCHIGSGADFRYGMSSLGPSSPVDATKRGSEDGIHFGEAVHDCIVRHCTFTGRGHVAINCYATDSTRGGVNRNVFHDNTFTGDNLSTAEAAFTLWSYSFPNRVRDNRIRNNIVFNTNIPTPPACTSPPSPPSAASHTPTRARTGPPSRSTVPCTTAHSGCTRRRAQRWPSDAT